MKYLGIFQVIWFILVVLFTLFELVIVIVLNLIRFLWDFKWPKTWWSDFNSAEDPWDNHWGGYEYKDKTPFETIKRRLTNTF